MTLLRRFSSVPTALVVATLLTVAGCGSSDSGSDPTTPADDSSTEGTDSSTEGTDSSTEGTDSATDSGTTASSDPADTTTASDDEADATAAPVDEGGSSGEVFVALDDGRSWTLQENFCAFDPDASGPAAAVINIDGSNDEGVGFGIIEAWPIDGTTENGTSFIGTLSDENDEVLVFLKDTAAMVGDEVEVTGGYYANVFYEDGDPFDGTYTVRCRP